MWNNSFELIDFHSHILPGVDDGAKDIDMSLDMLSCLSDEGIDKVVSTSHYYSQEEDISSFVLRRDKALSLLLDEIRKSEKTFPEIIPASEVRIYPDMWKSEDLWKLCIGSSKHILLEMPYDKWSDWMYAEIYSLTSRGYIPVMAHVERYIGMQKESDIEKNLLSLGVLIQCNSSFIHTRREKKFVKSLIEKNRLFAIGSDCHNTDTRPPLLSDALGYISKKYGDDYLRILMENVQNIMR